jgi:hypothetical protein
MGHLVGVKSVEEQLLVLAARLFLGDQDFCFLVGVEPVELDRLAGVL